MLDTDLPEIDLFADDVEIFENEVMTKTQQWLLQRRGKFTASEFFRLMTFENKGAYLPDGAKTYCEEAAIELLTEPSIDLENTYVSDSVQWGKDTEVEAVEMFALTHGITVEKYGDEQEFIDLENYGCTPDGLIGDDYGVEIKCPNSKTHLSYLKIADLETFKKVCTNYYWQIQGSLLITGRKGWYFVSYDPRVKYDGLRMKVLLIERNEADIDHLLERINLAVEYRDKFIADALQTRKN